MKDLILALTAALLLSGATTSHAIILNQIDDFQDTTTQGWTSGLPNPTPPTNVGTGGPGGAGDAFLQLTASGGFGPGSSLVTYNTTQWTGDYTNANVLRIRLDAQNLGGSALTLRLGFRGAGGDFSTSVGVPLAPGDGWQNVTFDITAADLVGGADAALTLTTVSQVRVLHAAAPSFVGDKITGMLGLDNIRALPVFVLGDVNLDAAANNLDIAPFISILTSGGFQPEADTNADAAVNNLDIAPFITILTSAPGSAPGLAATSAPDATVPEPASLAVLVLAALGVGIKR